MFLTPVFLLPPALAGCGGGYSKSDAWANAIHRPSDEEEETAAPAVAPQAKQNPVQAVAAAQTPPVRPQAAARQNSVAPITPAKNADSLPEPAERENPESFTPSQRGQRSVENMTAISQALLAYLQQQGTLPAAAICDAQGTPLLSWRVALLPYLGHEELYARFRLNEPWDSPHNIALLPWMPKEYQSPERFDDQTNYLVPVGSSALFTVNRPTAPRRVEDGLANTVLLLESNTAATWTEPQEHEVDLAQPASRLGGVRSPGYLVAWGNGLVSLVSSASPPQQKAMFTIDGGESFTYSQVHASPRFDSPEAEETEPVETVEAAATELTPMQHASKPPSPPLRNVAGSPSILRQPVPDQSAQEGANSVIREIYSQQWQQAKTSEQKSKLARTMLAAALKLNDDPAGTFMLLQVSQRIAVEAGDAETALKTHSALSERFEVDNYSMRSMLAAKLAGKVRGNRDCQLLFDEAAGLIEEAIQQDDYAAARRFLGIAKAIPNTSSQSSQLKSSLAERVQAAERTYQQVTRALDEVGVDSNNQQANLAVGRYYCLVKGQWEKGIPFLEKGSDKLLAGAAVLEQIEPKTPEETVRLADLWWEFAEQERTHAEPCRQRALQWYETALPELSQGLLRVKVEVRLRQAKE